MKARLRRWWFRLCRRLWGVEYLIYLEPGGGIKLSPTPLDGTIFKVTYRYGPKRELYLKLRPGAADQLVGRVKTRSAYVEIEL